MSLATLPASPTTQALELVGPATKLVEQIASTTFVPKAYRGNPGELLAAILTGYELGLGPMTAIAQIHNIEGTASLSAASMRALVLSHGHDIWIEDSSNHKVILGGRRQGSERDSFATWTIDDARKANLAGKKNWKQYPRAMLLARATGELCRAIFADVLAGIAYTDEEVADGFTLEDEDTAIAAVSDRPADAAKPKARRTTRKAKGAAKPKGQTRRTKPKAKPKPEEPAAEAGPEGDPLAEFAELAEMGGTPPADTIDTTATEEPADAKALPADRALAMRAKDVGLVDELRHGLYIALTSGRTNTGKELTTDEIRAAFELLDAVEADDAVVEPGEPGEWFVKVGGEEAHYGAQPPPDAPDPGPGSPPADGEDDPGATTPELDEDAWKALCAEHGRKPGALLLRARKIAEGLNLEPPRTLAELAGADEALVLQLAAWVKGE